MRKIVRIKVLNAKKKKKKTMISIKGKVRSCEEILLVKEKQLFIKLFQAFHSTEENSGILVYRRNQGLH